MIKIVYLCSTIGQSGPTSQMFNILKYLDRTIFDPCVVTLSKSPIKNRLQDITDLKIPVFSVDRSRFGGLFLAKREVEKIACQWSADIVHSHGFRADCINSCLTRNFLKICTIHNIPQQDYLRTFGCIFGKFMAMFHIAALRRFDSIIGVSESVAYNLSEKFKLANVVSINNGVDTDLFRSTNLLSKHELRQTLSLPSDAKVWVYSGHLTQLKNPTELIRGWKNFLETHENDHLVLLGDGPLQDACKKLATTIKNIHVLGYVSNVSEYLKASDFFISASTSEGFPMAILEAMATGLPPLLSNIPAHNEILTSADVCGMLFELNSLKSLNSSFNLLRNCDYSAMSIAAQKRVDQFFSAQIMTQAYKDQYIKTLKHKC